MSHFKYNVTVIGKCAESCTAAAERVTTYRTMYRHLKEIPELTKNAADALWDELSEYWDGIDIITFDQFTHAPRLFDETRLTLVEKHPFGNGYSLYGTYSAQLFQGLQTSPRLMTVNRGSLEDGLIRFTEAGKIQLFKSTSATAEVDFDAMVAKAHQEVNNLATLLKKNPKGSDWGDAVTAKLVNQDHLYHTLKVSGINIHPSHIQAVLARPEEAAELIPYTPCRMITAPNDLIHGVSTGNHNEVVSNRHYHGIGLDDVDAWFEYARLCKSMTLMSDHITTYTANVINDEI